MIRKTNTRNELYGTALPLIYEQIRISIRSALATVLLVSTPPCSSAKLRIINYVATRGTRVEELGITISPTLKYLSALCDLRGLKPSSRIFCALRFCYYY